MLVIGLAIVLGCAWWVANSKVFDLRTIRVDPTAHLTADRIERLAGLGGPTNVLWVSTAAVEARLERNPWVDRARVTRRLPSTIAITIEERVPVAVGEGSTPMLLAADGTVLARATGTTRLPVVELPPGSQPAPGDVIASGLPQLRVAGGIPTSLRAMTVRISRTSPMSDSMVLELRNGVTVYFGDADRAGEKARAVQALLAWASRTHVQPRYVDVRSPASPALMPSGASSPSQPPA